jgi:predicted Ser/Thr protein kinase
MSDNRQLGYQSSTAAAAGRDDGKPRRDTDVWVPQGEVMPSLLLSPGSIFADRYRIDQVLGSGGSGVVYKVWDRILERTAALKVLRRGASDKDLHRFRREVAVSQGLSHPGLVRVFDIGRCGDRDYFSMEYIKGETLADRLRRSGPLTIDEVHRLFREVAVALGHLHANGIIHRDIKPRNILIQESNGSFRLGDLGLAKSTTDVEISRTDMVGTPHYVAPEQVLGQAPNVRSDLYALGATLYEALTGKKTHTGSSGAEIAYHKTRRSPEPVQHLRPEVPAALATVVEGCLKRRPEARFESTSDVLETYFALHRGGSLKAPISRLRQRLRGRSGIIGVAGGLLLVALLIWAWQVRSRAVQVRIEQGQAVGINLWGGRAWTLPDVTEVGEARPWRDSSGRYHGFSVTLRPPRDLPGRQILLSPRGKVWLDTGALGLVAASAPDPRAEFSGTLAANIMRWSTGYPEQEPLRFPVRIINYPWYMTMFAVCSPGATVISRPFYSTGRVNAIAASSEAGKVQRYGLATGNNELLHMGAFAVLPAANPAGWSPPRMVEQADRANSLISYTLLPRCERPTPKIQPLADGAWQLSWNDGEQEILDRYGNRAVLIDTYPEIAPADLGAERMTFFARLSQIDTSRRAGALEVAERHYLATENPSDQLEQAALLWIGAKVAAERNDLAEVVQRTTRCAQLWPHTADPDLLRALARILAGEHALALADLDAAQTKLGSTADNTRLQQLASAWLSGNHSLATRLAEGLVYPYEKARRQAFLRIAEGDPAEALRLLDPWQEHFVRDRIQLLRALALVHLGRTTRARAALQAEVDRHGWLREECDWISLATDLAEHRQVAAERALTMLRRAEQRSRTELEVRLLLPWVRLHVASALVADGRSRDAIPILEAVLADHPAAAIKTQALQLLAAAGATSGER